MTPIASPKTCWAAATTENSPVRPSTSLRKNAYPSGRMTLGAPVWASWR